MDSRNESTFLRIPYTNPASLTFVTFHVQPNKKKFGNEKSSNTKSQKSTTVEKIKPKISILLFYTSKFVLYTLAVYVELDGRSLNCLIFPAKQVFCNQDNSKTTINDKVKDSKRFFSVFTFTLSVLLLFHGPEISFIVYFHY